MDDDDDWDDAVWSTIDALESSHLQNRQAQTPASAAAAAADAQQWACRSCTLLNSAPRTTCSVCSTPRGQVYAAPAAPPPSSAAAHGGFFPHQVEPAGAASAASLLLSQAKKTVQATLPFARAAATSANPVVTVGTPSRTPPTGIVRPRQSGSDRLPPTVNANGNSWPNNRSTAAPPRTSAPMGSKPASALGFPVQNGMPAAARSGTDEGIDEPDDVVPASAVIARLRHKGEDSIARTRYLSELDAPATRQQPQIDHDAARTFVYPTNYSVREYQLTIAEKALYHNTLVSLPTGLGKTLIASVVMYNFYRWFPQGQIVFMAPTKPLVAQQIGACHEIMGIPLSDTAELQGSVPPAIRKILWSTKRVFFCTPQSMQNDLQRGICRAERLVCLVVDEAHRATGNYAYCGVIHEVEKLTKQFRVLALSATPGAKFDVIQDVIRNLRITHIESRSADDSDVKKYTHARQEEVIKCSLTSQIAETKVLFLRVFDRITQRLLIGNIIQHKDPERLTRWYVLQMRERFRASPNYQSQRSAESDLALLVSVLHARDLLTAHGLASFKKWLDEFVTEDQDKGKRVSWSKKELLQSTEFQALRLSLEHVGGADSSSSSSHPKLLKLREVLHEHFQRHSAGQSSTRAIVFTQYRSSVQEIVKLLEPLFPLIKAQQFIGQGASGKGKESKGQTQKEQQEIVRKFRSGLFNVLVATCIAEEGLDIGEVDLIVSFDALTSPVRMIQRMGRTGRKRVGKVVILVTEGDEEKKLARSVSSAKTVSRALTTFKSKFVYAKCARMIPHGISPALSALEMDIPEFHASQIAGKQAAPRVTRLDGETAERRDAWKLNELERSIVRGKYTPTDWSDMARHEFFPVCATRKILLRRRRSDDHVGPSSTRSRALVAIVREINGVRYDDEVRGNRSSATLFVPPPTLDAYSGIGLDDDQVLEFSDPENGRDYDSHMHFSPPSSGAPEPTTPVRSQGVQTPRTGSGQAQLAKRSPAVDDRPVVSGERVSPLRQATITGKPSPSPTRRSSTGSGRKGRKKGEKPRDAIDKSLLERGERLINRLNAMLNEPSASMVDARSPEPEPPTVTDEIPAEEIQFQFPRIARRLKFDEPNEVGHTSGSTSIDGVNCVPLPPSINGLFGADKETFVVADVNGAHQDNTPVKDHGCPFTLRAGSLHQVTAGPTAALPVDPVLTTTACGASLLSSPHPDRSSCSGSNQSVNAPAYSVKKSPTISNNEEIYVNAQIASRSKKPKRSLALRVPIDELADEADFEPVRSRSPPGRAVERLPDSRVSEKTKHPTLQPQLTQRQESRPANTQGDPCSICCDHESFNDDPIVFCDGCNTAAHQFCYGVPVLPSDDWFCDSCHDIRKQGMATSKAKPRRCALCPMRSHAIAMKQTECGHWVHVQCFMWIPELRFHFESKQLRLGQLGLVDGDRKTLDCSLCHSKRGHGIIQCAHKRCLHAFHVSCASSAGSENYRLVQIDRDEGDEDETLFVAFCPLHNKSSAVWRTPQHSRTSPHEEAQAVPASIGTPSRDRSPARPSMLSPSALFATQAESSEKQRKQFRRLKRKYDTAGLTEATTKSTPPRDRSPWAKRVRRSQQHAEGKRVQAKALARMYIEDEVDAPSSGGDDEDDDDEMDEADREFINDSSQLIYSPSVPTPVRRKKSKRNSLGDMRAIYARSLIESPPTPAFQKRGRLNLPSNGVISACLQELNDERRGSSSASSPGSSQSSRVADREAAESTTDIIEIMDESQADPSQEDQIPTDVLAPAADVSIPSFDLIGISMTTALEQTPVCQAPVEMATEIASEEIENQASRELREKIEANRLKALRLLEEKKAATKRLLSAASAPSREGVPHESSSRGKDEHHGFGATSQGVLATTRGSSEGHAATKASDEPPSFNLLGAGVVSTKQIPTEPVRDTCSITVYVQPAFRESAVFDILEACRSTNAERLEFEKVESLDVTLLLSVRLAVVTVDAMSSETSNLLQLSMIQLASRVYKEFILVVRANDIASVEEISRAPNIQQIRQLPSCRNVIVTWEDAVIAKALLFAAIEEARLGFALSNTPASDQHKNGEGVDANFHARFRFFRSTGLLSIGSVLSLSFRFNKFTVTQIPVAKFGEMHWRRMLPWISETTAKRLHSHFVPHGA